MPEFLKKLTWWRRLPSREGLKPALRIHADQPNENLPKFEILTDKAMIELYFRRLRQRFTRMVAAGTGFPPPFRLEYGKLPQDRPYFYVAPWGEEGWLVELSPSGWVISQASKIVDRQTFMRSAIAVDSVALLTSDKEKSCLRLSSSLFGPELMTFPVYEAELVKFLDLRAPV